MSQCQCIAPSTGKQCRNNAKLGDFCHLHKQCKQRLGAKAISPPKPVKPVSPPKSVKPVSPPKPVSSPKSVKPVSPPKSKNAVFSIIDDFIKQSTVSKPIKSVKLTSPRALKLVSPKVKPVSPRLVKPVSPSQEEADESWKPDYYDSDNWEDDSDKIDNMMSTMPYGVDWIDEPEMVPFILTMNDYKKHKLSNERLVYIPENGFGILIADNYKLFNEDNEGLARLNGLRVVKLDSKDLRDFLKAFTVVVEKYKRDKFK